MQLFIISKWWALTGSNRRPSVRQTDALPAELNTQPTALVMQRYILYIVIINKSKYFLSKSKKKPSNSRGYSFFWCRLSELNQQPTDYDSVALPD